ncbi:hypothetical protein BGX28_006689 [Mortierella sp. GBA30]|nr:hypothetical protein BGX28_006689 [Mortierella sp. GBA30]
MAEQSSAPSRLSKSRQDYEAEIENLERTPAPVPRADRFFDRPAKSFDLDSVEHQTDEFGLAVKPNMDNALGSEEGSRDDEDDGGVQLDVSVDQEIYEEEVELTRAPNLFATHQTMSSGKISARSHAGLTAGQARQGSLFPNLKPDQGLTPAKSKRGFSPEDFGDEAEEQEVDQNHRDEESMEQEEEAAPVGRLSGIQLNPEQDSAEAGRDLGQEEEEQPAEIMDTAESQEQLGEQKQGQPATLFDDMLQDKGLVLAGLGTTSVQGDKRVEKEEGDEKEVDEELIPLPSLSDLLIASTSRDDSGLPVVPTKVVIESTAPENANATRWDQLDDGDSDSETNDTFSTHGVQDRDLFCSSIVPMTHTTDESPFAPFIRSSSRVASVPIEVTAASEKGEDRDVAQSKEHVSSDSDDAVKLVHTLGELAAGVGAGSVGSALLKSFFLDKESGDETSASVAKSSQFYPSSSEQKPITSTGSTEVPSSSEDNLTFDEGAGVGIGMQPQSRRKVMNDDTSSVASVPRYTTTEKGKQVVRDSVDALGRRDEIWDDLPPITSVTDKEYSGIERAPRFPMLSPTPVSPPAPQADEPRTRIYPAAPPGPWTSETKNSLSQRRVRTTDVLSTASKKNDPDLAFMSSASARKTPAAAPAAPKEGVKSLLTDFPDVSPKTLNATTQPSITLPEDPSKAPVLRGQYELPSIQKVEQWKSRHALAPNAFRRLLLNMCALIGTGIVMRAHFYRSTVKVLSSLLSPVFFYWTEWAVTLLFLFNIIEVLLSYMRSSNNFENLPLTPSQRTLLGLEPVITRVPGAVPVFKKSVSTSMSRTFNQPSVQDRTDLRRLMMNVEAREELRAERKTVDADPSKRPFGLQSGFGITQGGVDMSVQGAHLSDSAARPDLLASLNARGPVTRYQPALRTTLSKDHTSKTDLQKDGLYVVGHSKVLKNLKVSEEQLDRWVFNLRKWMWNMVVKPVCSEMEIVDEELAKQGLSYLDCKSATMFYTAGPPPQNATTGSNASTAATAPAPAAAPMANSLGWGAASIATARPPSAFASTAPQQPQLPVSLQDLETRYGESRIVRQRMILEQYLAIPGFANRKYVVERLQAMGPLLAHFIWDSHGIAWDGCKKTWTPDLPTDAQIIMHLFTVYMDLAMPAHPSMALDRFPFSYKYYVPMEAKPDPTTALQIKQTDKAPPNYNLVVDGSMWEVVPKRLNVWYTLVLFIYMVMKENGGYIGQLNIGTQMMGLGDVVEGYDM